MKDFTSVYRHFTIPKDITIKKFGIEDMYLYKLLVFLKKNNNSPSPQNDPDKKEEGCRNNGKKEAKACPW